MDTPGGPARRSGRWHEYVSKFDLQLTYIPGRYNSVSFFMSRDTREVGKGTRTPRL